MNLTDEQLQTLRHMLGIDVPDVMREAYEAGKRGEEFNVTVVAEDSDA